MPKSSHEWIILAVVLLTPLFFWPDANTSFELPKVTLFRALTFLLVAGTVIIWLKNGRKDVAFLGKSTIKGTVTSAVKSARLPLILLALVIIGWVVSAALSAAPVVAVFGYYPRFQGLYTLISYVIFAALVYLCVSKDEKLTERILNATVLSSLLVSMTAFLQSWGVPWLNHWDVSSFLGRFFGTMGHPDYLASFLVLAIPVQVERILSNRGRLLAFLALPFSLAALALTFSRSAFLGLFFALLIFLVVTAKKTGMKKLLIASLLTPVLLLIAVFSVNVFRASDFVTDNPLLSRMVLEDENLRSVQTRLVLWPATVRQIIDSPFYGFGPDSYAITFPKYAPAELNTLENLGDYPDRAHNWILDYAVQFGIPGVLVFLAFIGAVFYMGFRFVFKSGRGWLTPLALLSALAGLLFANLFGFFVTVTWVYFWLFTAMLLGIVTVAKREQTAAKTSRRFPPATAGVAAFSSIVAFIAVAAGAGVVWTQDISLFRADLAYRSGDLAEASRLAPQIGFYHYREAVQMTKEGAAEGAERALERMGAVNGYDGMYHLQKGVASGEFASFEAAISKMPTYAPAYLAYGKALRDAGEYAKAINVLQKYLNLCPKYYFWRYDLASRTPEEQEKYRIFYKLNPDFDEVFAIIDDAKAKAVAGS